MDSASTAAPKPPRVKPDWEAVERDYRTGRHTLRELAAMHQGTTYSGIARRAAAKGWTQDLAAAVRQATNAKLIATAATEAVNTAQQGSTTAVLAAAEAGAQIILAHRARARRAAEVARGILEELSDAAALDAHREVLAEILAGEEADAKKVAEARDAIVRALGIGARASTVQKLTDALAKAQAMERQAHNLDKEDDGDGMPVITVKDLTGRKAPEVV